MAIQPSNSIRRIEIYKRRREPKPKIQERNSTMKEKPKISIIIPCYNVAKYLKECLDSVVNQTLKDIEIICINDGSTDNTLNILEEYAKEDDRIRVFSQENKGVAVARNIGLEQVQGEYIMFADPDDYFIKNAFKIALNKIEDTNSDICIFNHYELNENEITENKNFNVTNKTKENLVEYSIYVWDKIYRTKFIKRNNITFCEGLKTAEDVTFSLICLFNKAKYTILKKPLYVYRIDNPNSATKDPNNIKNDILAFRTIYNLSMFQKQPLKLQLQIVARSCSGCLYYYEKFKATHKRLLKADIKEFLHLINKHYSEIDLIRFESYRKLKFLTLRELLRKTFSITNSKDKKFKILTIFGHYFRFSKFCITDK